MPRREPAPRLLIASLISSHLRRPVTCLLMRRHSNFGFRAFGALGWTLGQTLGTFAQYLGGFRRFCGDIMCVPTMCVGSFQVSPPPPLQPCPEFFSRSPRKLSRALYSLCVYLKIGVRAYYDRTAPSDEILARHMVIDGIPGNDRSRIREYTFLR